MTNVTKWLIAMPFIFAIAFVMPGGVAGDWLWFRGDWPATLYIGLTVGMWLAATAFVNVDRPRGPGDSANAIIPLVLILAVPLAVADRLYGPASRMPDAILVVAVLLQSGAVALGVPARLALGRAYQPRAAAQTGGDLVQSGPYRWIRHPLYVAALLWVVGWSLTIGSVGVAVAAVVVLLPTLLRRIEREEGDLQRVFGDEYDAYSQRTWRLVPFLY